MAASRTGDCGNSLSAALNRNNPKNLITFKPEMTLPQINTFMNDFALKAIGTYSIDGCTFAPSTLSVHSSMLDLFNEY